MFFRVLQLLQPTTGKLQNKGGNTGSKSVNAYDLFNPGFPIGLFLDPLKTLGGRERDK